MHRNRNTPKINIASDAILVMKGADVAFINPIGSTKNLDPSILKEWSKKDATLAEWSHRFMLIEMVESEVSMKDVLKNSEDFLVRVANTKTLKKALQVKLLLDSFLYSFDQKRLEQKLKFQPRGFGQSAMDYFK